LRQSNSDTDCNSNGHNNSYADCYGDSDRYRHSYGDSDGYRYSDGNCQRDGYPDTSAYANCQTCPHVETSPVSAAPTVVSTMLKVETRCHP
jgi:hypothetical protein